MDDELDPGTGGDEQVIDDGSGDGGQQAIDTSQGGGTQTQQTTQQTPPAGRVFTQAEVNTIVQNRLADERRRLAARTTQQQPQSQQAPQEQPGFDPTTRAALDAYLDAQLRPIRETSVKSEINTSFSEFQAKHPEFADQEVKDAVINTILGWGEDFVQRTPMNWLLEHGWLAYKYGAFDEKTFKDAAIAEYVANVANKGRKVPNAQGSGGKATTTPKPRGKEWKDTDAAMRQLIDEESSARA